MFSSLVSPLRCAAVWALACLPLLATHALAASVNFGSIAVGATSNIKSVTLTFIAPGTVGAVETVLLGAKNLDYTQSGGTCRTGMSYGAGQSCTVEVAFTPRLPGSRNGAAVLMNGSGATIATTYLTGIGKGSLATFPADAPTLPAGSIGINGFAVDGNGIVYYSSSGTPQPSTRSMPMAAAPSLRPFPANSQALPCRQSMAPGICCWMLRGRRSC